VSVEGHQSFVPPAPTEAFGKPPRKGWLRRRLGALGAAALALLAKLKAVLLLLSQVKLLATAGTALVSVAAYSVIWGWQFAVGFVALLFVHEMGHVVALRREGIKATAPLFIPFLGAMIGARSLGEDALAEARVGLAGPIFGSVAAAIVAVIGLATGSGLLEALGYIGFLLNLFNLLPVVPLDGGRAMAAMAPWMWFVGFGAIVLLDFLAPNPILLIITLFSAFELYRRWERRRNPTPAQLAYYRVAPLARLAVAAVYIGLIAALAFGMYATYVHRAIP
jgi:Zn-dependent protease